MDKRQLTVTVSTFGEAIKAFKKVWKQSAQGKIDRSLPIETLHFEDSLTLLKALTPKRLELLQHLHVLGNTSILAVSKSIPRDYRSVHQDMKLLARKWG